MKDVERRSDTLFVGSLAKGLRLLGAFDEAHTELGLGELAQRSGLDRSATQRLANTLYLEGFLDKNPVTRRFRPALRCLELGYAYLWSDPLVALAMPKLIELSRAIGETINMAELSGSDIVYVTRIPCQRTAFAATLIGRRVPALNTSSGRAILSAQPQGVRQAAVTEWPLRQFTPGTTLDRERIADLVMEAAACGYALSENELLLNEIGIAAPIADVDGTASAAVHCSVSAFRWTRTRIENEIVPLLLDTANAIAPTQRT